MVDVDVVDASDATAVTVVAVSAGSGASCVLLSNGGVLCWGGNGYGNLGDGTTASSATPVAPKGLGPATLVSTDDGVTCAVLASSALWCCGFGGRVGDGTNIQRNAPVEVVGAGVVDVVSGNTTCIALASGGAQCWGFNENGTIGDGTTTDSNAPVNVMSLGGSVTKIASGTDQACVVLATGSMQCWGRNFDGQLGDGTTTDHLTPVDVVSLGGKAESFATGETQVCALLTDGTVRCWGDGASGQMGNGKLTVVNVTPTQVPLSGSAKGLGCGDQFCCALLTTGSIQCWGDNTFGQLGDGTTTQRSSPVAVVSLAGSAISISVSKNDTTCALLALGAVQCWGLLVGSSYSTTPVTISGLP